MRIRDAIGFICIAAGITLAVVGVEERNFLWLAGGVFLAGLGVALLRSGRHDPDGIDVADALMDSIDD